MKGGEGKRIPMAKVLIHADSKFPVNRRRIRRTIERVLTEKGAIGNMVVSVAVVGDRKMSLLNKHYTGSIGTTDVLSFPYTEDTGKLTPKGFITPKTEALQLGDIVVSYPQAIKQAIKENKLVDDKIDFLVEHGLNHLLGIHHD
ncbi:rRNA maturation RNase YbeY [Microgenomates group bacterium RIFCSPHIGHO2_01_FULL_45_11]|nr:MAG: rRNA maturation RNase YbeY [Microgenomates group bacterium RIFCSPHIGHO2_01_FULL_45_11]